MMPKTVKEATTLILAEMSGRDKLLIRNTKKQDLIMFHSSIGQIIKNRCGLWQGNEDLMKDAGAIHPDSVSTAIVEGVWVALQKQ